MIIFYNVGVKSRFQTGNLFKKKSIIIVFKMELQRIEVIEG